ncbi:MAG TPA: S8 family serine peptidase [Longimicrobiaceae bacterium]|nr:S8 family serine peptidase [Longimicrobiaceae bacterium]
MKRFLPFTTLAVAGCVGLAACADTSSDGITAPEAAPAASSVDALDGQYLVLTRGNAQTLGSTVEALGGTVTFHHADAGFAVVGGLTPAAAAQLAGASFVAEVQPDVEVSLPAPQPPVVAMAADVEANSVANPATAIRYTWQWNMRAIGAQHAWAAGKLGSPDVTVAILDSGIDYTSLDMAGLVDLSRSTSFVASDNALRAAHFPSRHVVDDFNGHGTNVASQVSSKAVAHAGVTSKTTLIGVKVLGASGSGSTSGVLSGVLYAADQGADVINMSLGSAFLKAGGGGSLVSLINRVFSYANRKGAVIVVAAGNDSVDLDHDLFPTPAGTVHYPSLYVTYCDAPNVVCVSATGPQTATGNLDVPAYYTNFGRSAITVAAPGGNAGTTVSNWPWGPHVVSYVWSMCPVNYLISPATPGVRPCASGGNVNGYAGTSQAAPHVAGLAALLVAEMGKGNPAQVKARIAQSADDLGAPGTDPFYGKGRINVARALGL